MHGLGTYSQYLRAAFNFCVFTFVERFVLCSGLLYLKQAAASDRFILRFLSNPDPDE
jgi:hypothetical protein